MGRTWNQSAARRAKGDPPLTTHSGFGSRGGPSQACAWTVPMESQEVGEMALPKDLLEILACPKCVRDPGCTGELEYREAANQLVCHHCRLVYRIEDDIPVMLIDEATPLTE